jgi:DHA1 family bicyclomycin/chloramphenicol resistance-like MFS transporter
MVVLALAAPPSLWALLLPQWLYAFGHGLHQPCGQAAAVGPFPHAAGAAAALAGCVLALTAFAIGLWLGRALGPAAGGGMHGVTAYAAGVGFWSLVTCTVAWTLVRRLR